MGISHWNLLIILLIVIVLFGTKRLKNIGGDLGGAIKGFRKAMDSDEDKAAMTKDAVTQDKEGQTYEAEAHKVDEKSKV